MFNEWLQTKGVGFLIINPGTAYLFSVAQGASIWFCRVIFLNAYKYLKRDKCRLPYITVKEIKCIEFNEVK